MMALFHGSKYMKTGKISENVLKRSVLKRCKSGREEVAQGPGIGQDCAIVRSEGQKFCVLHTQAFTVERMEKIKYQVYCGVNNLCCSGGEAVALMMTVMMPEQGEEDLLRSIMDSADTACRECGIQLSGGHTEISGAVQVPVVTMTLMGYAKEPHLTKDIRQDLELVMAGYPALTGTALLAREKEEELKLRFPLELVETAKEFDQLMVGKEAAQIGWECGAVAMHDISQGGIFGALWEFCESNGIGMDADLRKIPIRQETIEICEQYGWNPYQLLSGGSFLMAVPDGQKTVAQMRQAGICSAVIGRTTDKKEKVLHNGEEMRYLDKPAQDEIGKLVYRDARQESE